MYKPFQLMTTWEIQTTKGPVQLQFKDTYGQFAHFHRSNTGILSA